MPSSKIGTLRENSLHAEIKNWYREPEDTLEGYVNGYLIDIIRDSLLIEIQTSHFSSVRDKYAKLITDIPLRVVYPIPVIKWVSRYESNTNVLISRRRSPKHLTIHAVFNELVYLPELVGNNNFSLEVLLVEQEDIWTNDNKGSWRRKYWSVSDRVLLRIFDRFTFYRPQDYCLLLPAGLPVRFTSLDLSKGTGIPRILAMKMLNCLRKMNQVEVVGKVNRANLYSVVEK